MATALAASGLGFGQEKSSDLIHYVYGFSTKSQLILGSQDRRVGGGLALAVGRVDPKLRMGNLPGELIWEVYFHQSSSRGVNGDPPNTSLSWGALASARYRWKFRPDVWVFADYGFGVQWANQTSNDIPLAFNTTPSIGFGYEFKTREDKTFIVSSRLLHVSNGGRKPPNPGQNFLQLLVGFRY